MFEALLLENVWVDENEWMNEYKKSMDYWDSKGSNGNDLYLSRETKGHKLNGLYFNKILDWLLLCHILASNLIMLELEVFSI